MIVSAVVEVQAPICPYCGYAAQYCASSAHLYNGRDFGPVWACEPCHAWVGCHRGTKRPLGRLADRELRYWKRRVHAAFDPIWQRRYEEKRVIDPTYTKAHARGGRYKALAIAMGIPRAECHIAMFDLDRCRRALEIIRSGAIGA